LPEQVPAGSDKLAAAVPGDVSAEQVAFRMSVTSVGIAQGAGFASPVLAAFDEASATGSLAVPIIMWTLKMVGIPATHNAIPQGQALAQSGATRSGPEAIGAIIIQSNELPLANVILVLPGIVGLIFCWLFIQFRSWLRVVALVGPDAGFGVTDRSKAGRQTLAAARVALFEMYLPVWPVFRGLGVISAARRPTEVMA